MVKFTVRLTKFGRNDSLKKMREIGCFVDTRSYGNKGNEWKAHSYQFTNLLIVLLGLAHIVLGSYSIFKIADGGPAIEAGEKVNEANGVEMNTSTNNTCSYICYMRFEIFQAYAEAVFQVVLGILFVGFILTSIYYRTLVGKYSVGFLMVSLAYLFSICIFLHLIGCDPEPSNKFINNFLLFNIEIFSVLAYMLVIYINIRTEKMRQMEEYFIQVLSMEIVEQLMAIRKQKCRVQKLRMKMENAKDELKRLNEKDRAVQEV